VGSMNPAIIRSSVVLPQPEGPSRKNNSPGSTARLMPSTARAAVGPLPKTLTRFSMTIRVPMG
jgi:hypothetical protein